MTLSTRTSDVKVARVRAAALSVRCEATRATVTEMMKTKRDMFTAREITDLYQLELEHELGAAVPGYHDQRVDHAGLQRTHRILAESYRIAYGLSLDQPVPDVEWHRLAAAGWPAKDVNAVRLMISAMCRPAYISDHLVRERLGELDLQSDRTWCGTLGRTSCCARGSRRKTARVTSSTPRFRPTATRWPRLCTGGLPRCGAHFQELLRQWSWKVRR